MTKDEMKEALEILNSRAFQAGWKLVERYIEDAYQGLTAQAVMDGDCSMESQIGILKTLAKVNGLVMAKNAVQQLIEFYNDELEVGDE
jgi:hypothetical protein